MQLRWSFSTNRVNTYHWEFMSHLKINGLESSDYWNFELGCSWFADSSRLAKLLAHVELYEQIIDKPGSVAEFGVHKGNSLIRWLSLRDLKETASSRTVIGFDAFGEFPKTDIRSVESDLRFIEDFEAQAGDGLSKESLESILDFKRLVNYELVQGNILETLPDYLLEHDHVMFSLVHLDLDVYEPTKFVLETIIDHIVPGGIIVIDDYNSVAGATRAVNEFICNNSSLSLQKTTYNYSPVFISVDH